MVLLLDEWNVIEKDIIEGLGFSTNETIYFDDVLGTTIYVALNDDLYVPQGDLFIPNFNDLDGVKDSAIELTIVGLITANEDTLEFSNGGIKYLYDLKTELLALNTDSAICQVQNDASNSVFDSSLLTEEEKEMLLSFIGCNDEDPFLIQIYTDSVEHKDAIKAHIASFNEGREIEDKIFEIDLAKEIG